MKKTIRKALFLILISAVSAFASENIPAAGTSTVEVRAFDTAEITQLKKDFKYDRKPPEALNIWGRFLQWLIKNISGIISNTAFNKGFQIFLYASAVLLILYAVLTMLKLDLRNFVYGKSKNKLVGFSTLDENIHEMDFEGLIRQSINKKDFRKAIRLYYLSCLKTLADYNLIDWRQGKTNNDYLSEFKSPKLKGQLEDISYIFQYVWYGEFEIDEEHFMSVKEEFESFLNVLNQDKQLLTR